jgi:hypothetical protein
MREPKLIATIVIFLAVAVTLCIALLYLAGKFPFPARQPRGIDEISRAARSELLDGHTLEGMACGYGGPNIGQFNLAPGECGDLIEVFRDLLRSGDSISQPRCPSRAVPAALGTDCVGFPPQSSSKGGFVINKYAIWLDVGPYRNDYPGSIGFIRLVLVENIESDVVIKEMPLYPAELARIRDAVAKAKTRQLQTKKVPP